MTTPSTHTPFVDADDTALRQRRRSRQRTGFRLNRIEASIFVAVYVAYTAHLVAAA